MRQHGHYVKYDGEQLTEYILLAVYRKIGNGTFFLLNIKDYILIIYANGEFKSY